MSSIAERGVDLERARAILSEVRTLDDAKREVLGDDTIRKESPGGGEFKIRMYKKQRPGGTSRGVGYYLCISARGPRDSVDLRSVAAVESSLVHTYGIDAAALGIDTPPLPSHRSSAAASTSTTPIWDPTSLQMRATLRIQTTVRMFLLRRQSHRHSGIKKHLPDWEQKLRDVREDERRIAFELEAVRTREQHIIGALTTIEDNHRTLTKRLSYFVRACTGETVRIRDDALPNLLRTHTVFDGSLSTVTVPAVTIHSLVVNMTNLERADVTAYAKNLIRDFESAKSNKHYFCARSITMKAHYPLVTSVLPLPQTSTMSAHIGDRLVYILPYSGYVSEVKRSVLLPVRDGSPLTRACAPLRHTTLR